MQPMALPGTMVLKVGGVVIWETRSSLMYVATPPAKDDRFEKCDIDGHGFPQYWGSLSAACVSCKKSTFVVGIWDRMK